MAQEDWEVLIWDHHPGYIDRDTFDANQARIHANRRARAGEPGGAVREGQALLQGIAVCGRCSRKLGGTTRAGAITKARCIPAAAPGRSGACASGAAGSTRRSPARCSRR